MNVCEFVLICFFCLESTPRQTPWGQASYIYGRYKRFQSVEVDESFFPVIYASPGQGQERTIWLDDYIHS